MSFQILQGDALTILRTLPAESVHCCVTSPPYWGLRDYKLEPLVWGGDAGCGHEWGEEQRVERKGNPNGGLAFTGTGSPETRIPGLSETSQQKSVEAGSFCSLCGAWRGSLGLEPTPELYVAHLVEIFREVRRVLRADGTLWLNLGDSYASTPPGCKGVSQSSGLHGAQGDTTYRHTLEQSVGTRRSTIAPGLKPKDLIGIPWRVAFALQADGWWLRSDIIWHKPNPMPESVTDRPTKAHEYIFLLSKSAKYYYNAEAIKEQASADTHARYARGRSDSHKWADGGPGNQTIATNKPGSLFGQKTPAGWHQGTRAEGSAPRDQRAPGVNPKAAANNPGSKQNSSFSAAVKDIVETRNKRSVWTIPTQPTPEAHFATYPVALVEPCIMAGCPPAGKRCDCDEEILTPTGDGESTDPTMHTGRAGMNRERRPNGGRRPITRREQRSYAAQVRESPHRAEMESIAGPAFAHYIRTDNSGARPLPPELMEAWMGRGWLTTPAPCCHPSEEAGTVLDPFAGAGTTGLACLKHGRNFLGIELNPEYIAIAESRIEKHMPLFQEVVL